MEANPKPTPRDRSRRAQARRLRFLRQNPLCASCLKLGRARQAAELDHVVPLHKGGPDDEENWQGLCLPCHKAKSREDRGLAERPEIGPDGWPLDVGVERRISDDDENATP